MNNRQRKIRDLEHRIKAILYSRALLGREVPQVPAYQKIRQRGLKEGALVFDTETTGLGEDAEIVEIAVAKMDGTIVLDEMVKPWRPIPDSATAIHGIDNAAVVDKPRWGPVFMAFSDALRNGNLVAYNIAFDIRLVQQSNAAYNAAIESGDIEGEPIRPRYSVRTLCAMELYNWYRGEYDGTRGDNYKWHKLTEAAKYFSLQTQGAHRALSDVRMTIGILNAMADQDFETLLSKLRSLKK